MVPPVGAVPAIPSHEPKQVSFVKEVGVVKTAGSVMIAVPVAWQPVAFIATIEYVAAPTVNVLPVVKVVPPSILYCVAPAALIVIVPFVLPKHSALVVLIELITTSSTVTLAVIGVPTQDAVLGVIV